MVNGLLLMRNDLSSVINNLEINHRCTFELTKWFAQYREPSTCPLTTQLSFPPCESSVAVNVLVFINWDSENVLEFS